jgi:hypothetical protein
MAGRLGGVECGQRLVPVGGLGDHLQIRFCAQDHPQPASDQGVVVKQYSRGLGEHHSPRSRSGTTSRT